MGLFTNYKVKSDEELMVLVQDGDHRAFTQVYDRYADRMKAYFYRMLWRDEEMAEDYVHDLFSKVVEQPNRFHTSAVFKPWLFQVASNMCKNAYRKHAFQTEYLAQLRVADAEDAMIEENIDQEAQLDVIQQTLSKLDEDKKQLFLLRYQQGMSVAELAATFNLAEGTVKSSLHYIRKKLIKELNNHQMIEENEGSNRQVG